MSTSSRVLAFLGGILLGAGLLFTAQGTGLFPYPPASFMIDQRPWVWRGLALAAAGAAVILVARRRR